MLALDLLARSFGLPLAVTAGALVVGQVAERWAGVSAQWSGGVGAGAAFMAAYVAVSGRPTLPPLDTTGWLFWAALGGAAWAALSAARPSKIEARSAAPAWLVLSACLSRLLLAPLVERDWSSGQAALWLGAATLALTALWGGISALASSAKPVAWAGALALGSAAAALSLAATGSVRYGMLGAALTAGAMAVGVTSALRPDPALQRGVAAVFGPVLGGLLVCGVAWSSLPVASALCLALTPLTPALAARHRAAAPMGALITAGGGLVLALLR